jgi:hypothetical protein
MRGQGRRDGSLTRKRNPFAPDLLRPRRSASPIGDRSARIKRPHGIGSGVTEVETRSHGQTHTVTAHIELASDIPPGTVAVITA